MIKPGSMKTFSFMLEIFLGGKRLKVLTSGRAWHEEVCRWKLLPGNKNEERQESAIVFEIFVSIWTFSSHVQSGNFREPGHFSAEIASDFCCKVFYMCALVQPLLNLRHFATIGWKIMIFRFLPWKRDLLRTYVSTRRAIVRRCVISQQRVSLLSN